MKRRNWNKGVFTYFQQTEDNNFDEACVVLEGTSVRDKVNHLKRSFKDPAYFFIKKKKTLKNKEK